MRILFFLLLFTVAAVAQTGTFFEAGLGGSYGSNARKKSFPEVYGAVGVRLLDFNDSTVQARLGAKYSRTPELQDIFARDDNPTRIPSGELILHPVLRCNLSTKSYFKPFIAAGGEYRRQFGLTGHPYSSLNPTLTFGTRVGYGYEVAYTRLFSDRFNRSNPQGSSNLRGDRIGANYSIKLSGKFHFKFGAEGDYVSYRACDNVSCDGYREYDYIVRPFAAISIY